MNWQTIETAPKDGKFLATDGALIGIGSFYRREEPAEIGDWGAWNAHYQKVHAAFSAPFTRDGLFPKGFDYLANRQAAQEAWEAAKGDAPPVVKIPNPKAGQVEEWYYASACHAFDGEAATRDDDDPIGFRPTHWMPLPVPPPAQ